MLGVIWCRCVGHIYAHKYYLTLVYKREKIHFSQRSSRCTCVKMYEMLLTASWHALSNWQEFRLGWPLNQFQPVTGVNCVKGVWNIYEYIQKYRPCGLHCLMLLPEKCKQKSSKIGIWIPHKCVHCFKCLCTRGRNLFHWTCFTPEPIPVSVHGAVGQCLSYFHHDIYMLCL